MNDNTRHQIKDAYPLINQQTPAPTAPPNNARDKDRALKRALRDRLTQADCFKPAPWAYGFKIALVLVVSVLGYMALLTGPDTGGRTTLTLLIAFACVQAGFIAHDAGDGGVTSNRRLAFGLRHILMSFVSALSSSYFNYLHKVHHLTLHRGGRGLGGGQYAVNPYEISGFKNLVSFNGIVFGVATVCLRGLTFKLESLRYVLKNRHDTKVDRVLMTLHALFWLVLPIPFIGVFDTVINYGLITLFIGPYVGTVLILNHEGMSKAQSLTRLSMIERITRTTRNLGPSRLSDFFFGGVNNHIEHHLFPQIPAARLPRARAITNHSVTNRVLPIVKRVFSEHLSRPAKHFRTMPRSRLAAEALS